MHFQVYLQVSSSYKATDGTCYSTEIVCPCLPSWLPLWLPLFTVFLAEAEQKVPCHPFGWLPLRPVPSRRPLICCQSSPPRICHPHVNFTVGFCTNIYFILLKSKLVYVFKLAHALYTNSCESTHMIYCHTTENILKAYLIKDLGMEYVKDAYKSITRRKTI